MKTKKKKKSRKRKSRGKSHKIIDPKFSTRKHHGTAATPNDIFYHYQKYSNIMEYLYISLSNKLIVIKVIIHFIKYIYLFIIYELYNNITITVF